MYTISWTSHCVGNGYAQIHHGDEILELADHFGKNFVKLPNNENTNRLFGDQD
jgi:hypothetical protein